mmetsp:Transcript_52218/g.131928  ORF Transcript_52218/g.131928 Transcript_52218/m.131928 type:complete len:201 (+) Transcript_52218:109-711(+)
MKVPCCSYLSAGCGQASTRNHHRWLPGLDHALSTVADHALPQPSSPLLRMCRHPRESRCWLPALSLKVVGLPRSLGERVGTPRSACTWEGPRAYPLQLRCLVWRASRASPYWALASLRCCSNCPLLTLPLLLAMRAAVAGVSEGHQAQAASAGARGEAVAVGGQEAGRAGLSDSQSLAPRRRPVATRHRHPRRSRRCREL